MSFINTLQEKNHPEVDSEKRFSILIPSWNNLPYLKLCIESIRKNSLFNHQIIVHVNEGKDGTLEWVREQSNIDYTYSANNIGICYALNYAAQQATTDYILYMNDDMYVCPDWDKAISDEIKAIGHPYFFLSATMIEPYNTNNNCVIHHDYGTDLKSFNEDKLLKEYQTFKKPDWTGATWPPNIVHRDIWNAVGGYSVEFHPGMYSDPDFSMKLWKMGIRLFKGVGESKVYHFSGRSTGRVKKNKGYFTFIQKWGMTSGYVMTHFLHKGEEFHGMLTEPVDNAAAKVKNLFKRVSASLHA